MPVSCEMQAVSFLCQSGAIPWPIKMGSFHSDTLFIIYAFLLSKLRVHYINIIKRN